MSEQSLLAHLYARPHLFRRGETVYICDPDKEEDPTFADALRKVIRQLGDGPFTVTNIRDTPDSKAAPQNIQFGAFGSNVPFMDGESPLSMTGYALETRP
jgi:hypothetical protein